MAKHNETGYHGEKLAVEYLHAQEFNILHCNWRHRHWEVDIIASKKNVLHFIEVKTRRTKNFGTPEEKVTDKKMKHLINASEEYLHQNPQWKNICFDILSISIFKNKPIEYFFIEDVFL